MIIENINKEMDQRVVLKNITLELAKHEIVGLVGRNGSGKTTLLRVMAGHYLPDAGDITIDQRSIFEYPEMKQELFFIDEKENFLRTYSLKKISAFYQLAYPNFDTTLFTELVNKHAFVLSKTIGSFLKGSKPCIRSF